MQAILNADFDIDNPQCDEYAPFDLDVRGDYYARVTKFLSGGFEVIMKVVRPMALQKQADAFAGGYPVSLAPRPEKSASEIEAEKVENHQRAVKKAIQTTRYLCQQMKADRLLTLTYRDNVQDREKVKADFKQFLRLVRNGWKGQAGLPGWRYVAVLERQERGAYHVHCAVQGYQPVKFIRQCWYKALGASATASGADTPGQIDITSPRTYTGASRKKEWATHRLAAYIVKYMSKTFDETTTEKNRYWRAKDIVKPDPYRHWLVATSLGDALQELFNYFEARGMQLKKHWLSDDKTCYWVQGVCHEA